MIARCRCGVCSTTFTDFRSGALSTWCPTCKHNTARTGHAVAGGHAASLYNGVHITDLSGDDDGEGAAGTAPLVAAATVQPMELPRLDDHSRIPPLHGNPAAFAAPAPAA